MPAFKLVRYHCNSITNPLYHKRLTALHVLYAGGCSPKLRGDASSGGAYMSIHPGVIPAIGPTVIAPLPGNLSQNLQEDMEIEASYLKQDTYMDESSLDKISHTNYRSKSTPPPEVLPPDEVIKLYGLNTNEMHKKITEVRRGVSKFQVTYQLLPNVHTLDFAYQIPHYLNYDHIDVRNLEKKNLHTNRGYGSTSYNCTSLVADILHSGGCTASGIARSGPSALTPWALTPNDLSDQLRPSDGAGDKTRASISSIK